MKKNIIFASLVLAVAIIVILVSCKKENNNLIPKESNNESVVFEFPNVDDMNAYLKEYKQKISQTRGDETVSLSEAEWHLSSLANYDFGYANVEYGDFRFDTLYTSMTVSGSEVRLSDLGIAYSELSASIASYFESLDLENKHIRFVDVSVLDDGQVMSILGITSLWNHTWHFNDFIDAFVFCDSVFNSESLYLASGFGRTELQRVLNLLEGRLYATVPVGPQDSRTYLLYLTQQDFNWEDWIDPYGSPNYCNSRLFASLSLNNPDLNDNSGTICYLLDSYLGLGCDYAEVVNHDFEVTCVPVEWFVYYVETPYHLTVASHKLLVKYAIPVSKD